MDGGNPNSNPSRVSAAGNPAANASTTGNPMPNASTTGGNPTGNANTTNARPRYRVPDELRETLLDFTIAYLLERPPSVVDFGAEFFQRLRGDRLPAGGGRAPGQASDINANVQSTNALPVELLEPSATPSSGLYNENNVHLFK